tara:strand:+ start:327 stop:542 length:216 start_codon:yes stop_codon:yes gene_type:complete
MANEKKLLAIANRNLSVDGLSVPAGRVFETTVGRANSLGDDVDPAPADFDPELLVKPNKDDAVKPRTPKFK